MRKTPDYPGARLRVSIGPGRRSVGYRAWVFYALLAGAGIAYIGALPVAGPVAVLILDRALAGRRREALALALGAAIPEGFYAGGAALGAAALLDRVPALLPVAQLLAGCVVLVVGGLLLRERGRRRPASGVQGEHRGARRGAVVTALLLTALNPTLLATWAAVGAPLVATGVIRGAWGAASFGAGAALGAWAGGATLAILLVSQRSRLGDRGVRIARRGAGALLLVLGAALLVRALLLF